MPFIESINGVKIHYSDTGQGIPLVLIHGWGMSGKVWKYQSELADYYRLVTLDLRGHGKSSAPPEGYGFTDFAKDIEAVISVLELDRAILVGWSMGVQALLQAVPSLNKHLSGLILVSGTARFTSADGYPHGLPSREVRGLSLRFRRDNLSTLEAFFAGMFSVAEESEGLFEMLVADNLPAPHAALASLASLENGDHRHLLPEIHIPTLVIHGDADTVCPPEAGEYLARNIGGPGIHIMPGAGHAPFLSMPQQFNATLRKFVGSVVNTTAA